jgi:hypothetical protein
MGAFRTVLCTALLAVGCGDRTGLVDQTSPGAVSGSSSPGAVSGSSSPGAVSGSSSADAVSGSSSADAVSASIVGASGTPCGQTACGQLCIPCDDQCVDPQIDTRNCGGCGVACPVGMNCVNGTCACPLGWTECPGESGAPTTCVLELALQTDPRNCGQCGAQCPASAPTCVDGSCH